MNSRSFNSNNNNKKVVGAIGAGALFSSIHPFLILLNTFSVFILKSLVIMFVCSASFPHWIIIKFYNNKKKKKNNETSSMVLGWGTFDSLPLSFEIHLDKEEKIHLLSFSTLLTVEVFVWISFWHLFRHAFIQFSMAFKKCDVDGRPATTIYWSILSLQMPKPFRNEQNLMRIEMIIYVYTICISKNIKKHVHVYSHKANGKWQKRKRNGGGVWFGRS